MTRRQQEDFLRDAQIMRLLRVGSCASVDLDAFANDLSRAVRKESLVSVQQVIKDLEWNERYMRGEEKGLMVMVAGLLQSHLL